MNKKKLFLAVLLLAAVSATAGIWSAASALKEEGKPAAMASARYLLISPHTKEECLQALDGVAAAGKDMLAKWEWGCMAGDHTGYVMIEAKSDEGAIAMVPEAIRPKARAIKLTKFTAEDIQSFHKSH